MKPEVNSLCQKGFSLGETKICLEINNAYDQKNDLGVDNGSRCHALEYELQPNGDGIKNKNLELLLLF